MAIIPGSNFHFKGKKFLDDRQTISKPLLKTYHLMEPLPEGFEVYVPEDRNWYVFDPNTWSEDLGHFTLRTTRVISEESPGQEYSIPIYRESVAQNLNSRTVLQFQIQKVRSEVIK